MENRKEKDINRRSFLRSTAAASAGLVISQLVFGQTTSSSGKVDDINVALLGAGQQGQTLTNACLKIPGIRFKAVCDIWKEFNLQKVSESLRRAYKHENTPYQDYQEMLAKEKDLDAVIIATPDFWHSRQTIACLEAGLHVYCETPMSISTEDAKKMVEAARKTGKLLQIGNQRRSNPAYIYSYEKYMTEAKIFGQLTTINGQWNLSKEKTEFKAPLTNAIIEDTILKKYEYDSMEQFRNWQWFKGKGSGPIVELGSYQIDIYNWFLDAKPKSVIACGRMDYWKSRQWYDNVMAIYEYQTKDGNSVGAFYQTISTNSGQGSFEQFMGIEGTLVLSESATRCKVYREKWFEETKEIPWEKWVKKGYVIPIDKNETETPKSVTDTTPILNITPSPTPQSYNLPASALLGETPPHQPHLENFFNAIRGKEKLNCPAEVGYETAVTVLKINEAIETGKKLDFKPEEFKV
jgi:predicted dehydrogenase